MRIPQAFDAYAFVLSKSGDCSLASGCDRFVLGGTDGFRWGDQWATTIQLLAVGAAGSTFVTDRQALIAFLGAIDTPNEAALLAALDGYTIDCESLGVPARKAVLCCTPNAVRDVELVTT